MQQPFHHVALGEHLGFAGDFVGGHLAAAVELVVEGFPLRVVPVLVDPAQGSVVAPGVGVKGLQGFNSRPQGAGRNGKQFC